MKKEWENPRILPNPLPKTPGIVEPIIAAGEMNRADKTPIRSDVDGSYTGRPVDDIHPVQDADDL